MRDAQHGAKEETLKKAPRKAKGHLDHEIRAEYRLDHGKARENRFAGRVPRNAVAVVLDPDVTRVFASSDSVNALLRSVIRAMPAGGKVRRKAG